MFKYFLNITLRSLSKKGMFPIINILGLSIGLAVVLLISLLVFNERSFDRGFAESKNIYRINSKLLAMMPGETFVTTANSMGPAVQDAVPEVVSAVRTYSGWLNMLVKEQPTDLRFMWVDEDFFRLFDTPFIYGSPEAVMSRPNAAAISEETAKRLFGNNNPIGELLAITGYNQPPMEIAAVFKDYPKNSSFGEFKAIAPFEHCFHQWVREPQWGNISFETFCLLSAGADTSLVNAKMRKTLLDATATAWEGNEFYYPVLQRLTDIHLHSSKYMGESLMTLQSDVEKVRMLFLLSIIILLVACINYMNLSTARAQKRSREIGVSKTIGAKRSEIIIRLTFETAIFTFMAFILAFAMAWLTLPVFNTLLGEQLSLQSALKPGFAGVALSIWIITTLLAASYPVIYMSGFPPLFAIKSQLMVNTSHAVVRKVLTVGQFAVAVVLIAWVLIIQAQIMFVSNKDLGYNTGNLVGFWIQDGNNNPILNDLRAESSVIMASSESSNVFQENSTSMLTRNADDKAGFPLTFVCADPDLIDVLQIKLIAGRHLPEQQQSGDTIMQVVLNRSAVEYLGITPEEAIGKRINIGFGSITEVCGVTENFHFESLHRPVNGYCFHNSPMMGDKNFILLRVKEGNLAEQLKTYEQIYKRHFPNRNFYPMYPGEHITKAYDGERRTGKIAIIFSILAILVACMGVFGLTAFMAEQRTKEIGVRKVMGASVLDIVHLFTNNYTKLLCISLIIAIPLAWWVGSQYLQNFAFRVSIGWWIFAVAALITVVLTLLTISMQAIKAAMKNPVEAIQSE